MTSQTNISLISLLNMLIEESLTPLCKSLDLGIYAKFNFYIIYLF